MLLLSGHMRHPPPAPPPHTPGLPCFSTVKMLNNGGRSKWQTGRQTVKQVFSGEGKGRMSTSRQFYFSVRGHAPPSFRLITKHIFHHMRRHAKAVHLCSMASVCFCHCSWVMHLRYGERGLKTFSLISNLSHCLNLFTLNNLLPSVPVEVVGTA